MTGAQLSSRAHAAAVEDYASMLLRAPGGPLGTIEAGNTFPGKGADAEWKLAGRDALLMQRDGALRCVTREGEQSLAAEPPDPLPAVALREALSRWREGKPPVTGPEDCYRAMRVVDAAYGLARAGG